MTGRCLFGFSGEKPFLLPDNEGVKMNTSPVRMDDLPLNRFHCRIAALTFGAHLTDGYVLGVIGYAIIQLTPAMQLTPFMAGMIGGSALLGLFLGSLVLGWISDHIGRQKIFTFSFLLITLASFLQFFATTPEHLIGLRIKHQAGSQRIFQTNSLGDSWQPGINHKPWDYEADKEDAVKRRAPPVTRREQGFDVFMGRRYHFIAQ